MTASLIAKFRKQTQQGMMDCKKFIEAAKSELSESASEAEIFDLALDLLTKASSGKIKKRAAREANEGVIVCAGDDNYAYALEVNCETDFVARNDVFKAFVADLSNLISEQQPLGLTELLELPLNGSNVAEVCKDLIIKIGENIRIGKFFGFKAGASKFVAYNHGGRLAVVVEYEGDAAAGKDIALHIAANSPAAIDESGVCAKMIATEKAMYEEQAKESGKPDDVQAKMVQGKMSKFLAEVTLLGQKFVKDEDVTVAEFLKKNTTKILSFKRVALGEVEEV